MGLFNDGHEENISQLETSLVKLAKVIDPKCETVSDALKLINHLNNYEDQAVLTTRDFRNYLNNRR